MGEGARSSDPTVRRIRFDWCGIDATNWHPRLPEFAAGANAISLLMPHAEPFVITHVRRTADSDPAIEEWASQEAMHHRAHRGFNKQLTHDLPVARRLDRLGHWIFAHLANRSDAFGLAFAAAFELVAFASARWAEAGMRRYLTGADETAATLFLWHLAEEVEHKGIVHDQLNQSPAARRLYPIALLVAFVVLIGFTVVGGLALFVTTRAALSPRRWMNLIGWGFSLAFVLLPVLVVSLSPRFDPHQLVDPPWMAAWLDEYDPASETLPVWTQAGMSGPMTPPFSSESSLKRIAAMTSSPTNAVSSSAKESTTVSSPT
ncbi:MAG: metal-dependent hydrolase [Acidimicrobiales bacterium]